MTANKYELVDIASEWLVEKNASYLSKESKVVYYASMTGRKSDFKWYKLSLPETVRIISASLLPADSTLKLKPEHVLTAAQELERVYEMGVSSRFPVSGNVFNYLDEAETDLPSMVMLGLCRALLQLDYTAFRLPDLVSMYKDLNNRLQLGQNHSEISNLYWCHLPELGYEIRAKTHRVILQGRKQTVVMMPGLLPRHVVDIPDSVKQSVVKMLETSFK